MIFGAFTNVHVCSSLFPTATGKVAYVIKINCSDPCSVSPNPGCRHIKIKKSEGSLRHGPVRNSISMRSHKMPFKHSENKLSG